MLGGHINRGDVRLPTNWCNGVDLQNDTKCLCVCLAQMLWVLDLPRNQCHVLQRVLSVLIIDYSNNTVAKEHVWHAIPLGYQFSEEDQK